MVELICFDSFWVIFRLSKGLYLGSR